MHFKDGDTVGKIRQIDVNLTVETPGAQQSFVEYVGAVSSGKNNHAAVAAETIHLCKQLV